MDQCLIDIIFAAAICGTGMFPAGFVGGIFRVAAMKDVRVIGHIVSDTMGLALITRDGVEMQLKAQGWTPQEK